MELLLGLGLLWLWNARESEHEDVDANFKSGDLGPSWWHSDRADRLGINNMPTDPTVFANLLRLRATINELFGPDVIVTSGYRSPELNAATPQSVPDSLHVKGLAADLAPPEGLTAQDLYDVALSQGIFKEVILYGDGHVHVALYP